MGIPVIFVDSGGLPVTESTNGIGWPVSISTNGFGRAVTLVASGGLAIISSDLPTPPEGFSYLLGADGAELLGADGAYLLGVA